MPTNRLAREKSPYLLQHAHNPVDWYPWGDEAFARAAAEDKPVFLSIGYSTCHWCHVMERESFENEEIAAVLNRDFISVKVDREERPDVDRLYMLFVQASTGSGGWPMSVWLTPDRKPFYGGTYFAPDSRYGRPGFPYLLEQIAAAWKGQREKLVTSSEQILADLKKHVTVEGGGVADFAGVESTYQYFRRTFDKRLGGFGGAPKFPRPSVLLFLFRHFFVTGNAESRDMALFTLREMARGGMNDQLGGGFHRYSVDDRWFVPHFEKMLYDQAQLAGAYLEAYQISGDALYAGVARDILEYVLRDMTHPEGGFYSAEDADSVIDAAHPHEKGEGAFYIWKAAEIEAELGAEAAAWFAYRYGVEDEGNVEHDPHGEFTGRNILFEANTLEQTARRYGVPAEQMAEALRSACARLLAARPRLKVRPHLDDKVLTAWNGLMIGAFAQGGRVLGEARYTEAAERAARFVLSKMYDPATGTLLRRWREGEGAVEGFLDDYASLGNALVDLYEATFETEWLELARGLASGMRRRFEDGEHGAFFSTSAAAADLLLRMKEDYDGAEPAGNSLAALLLVRLAAYFDDESLLAPARRLFAAFAAKMNEQGVTLPLLLAAWMQAEAAKTQIVVAGDAGAAELLAAARRAYRPFATFYRNPNAEFFPRLAGMGPVEGRAAAYVCANYACQLPVTETEELRKLLQ